MSATDVTRAGSGEGKRPAESSARAERNDTEPTPPPEPSEQGGAERETAGAEQPPTKAEVPAEATGGQREPIQANGADGKSDEAASTERRALGADQTPVEDAGAEREAAGADWAPAGSAGAERESTRAERAPGDAAGGFERDEAGEAPGRHRAGVGSSQIGVRPARGRAEVDAGESDRRGRSGAGEADATGDDDAEDEAAERGSGDDARWRVAALADSLGARWSLRRVGVLLTPALIFLGVREFGLLVLTWMAAENGRSVTEALRSWDGQWFLAIAEGGYAGVPASLVDAFGNRSAETPLAFFPGYPMVVRWFAGIDGSDGIGLVTSAFTVTIVSGVVCSYALARLGRHVRGGSRRVGLVLVALFAAAPMSVVLSMAYSEAMFCAFAAWSLVGVLERRWVLAGVCCALAGLVRSTGAALLLAVGLAIVVAVVRRRDGWRPWVGGVIAPAGLVGYLAWVGVKTGEWDGWFALQERGWGTGFDGGKATVTFSLEALADARSVLEVTTVALIVVALALLVIGFVRRVEWPLMVFAVGVLAMDLGANGLMNSKARLMIPAFTLLVPLALALAKRKPSTALLTLCALAVASSWFGAYSITSWGYAI